MGIRLRRALLPGLFLWFCTQGIASAQNPDEWPILHNTNHLSFSATTKLKPPLKVKWVTKIHSVVQNPGPVVGGGKVIINDERGTIYCLDAETGELVWRYFVKKVGGGGLALQAGTAGTTSPCIWNGRVYAVFSSKGWPNLNGMRCFDLKTGQVLWKENWAGYVEARIKYSPQVAGGRIFLCSNVDVNRSSYAVGNYNVKAQVQCWDAMTGDSLWTYTMWDTECQNTTLLVVGDTVFASVGVLRDASGGKTVVFDLNGNVRWSSTVHHVSSYLGNLQYLPGQLWMLCAGTQNATKILNTSDWSVRLSGGGGDEYSKVNAIMNGKYWNRTYNQAPVCYNASDGKQILTARTYNSETFTSGCSIPVAANGYIYEGFGSPSAGNEASGGHKWCAWDESGNPVWSFQVASNCCPPLAIAYDKLYAVTGADGLVYCFENAQ